MRACFKILALVKWNVDVEPHLRPEGQRQTGGPAGTMTNSYYWSYDNPRNADYVKRDACWESWRMSR